MMDNPKTTTPATAKMEPPQTADIKPQATKSRRSVHNMNPIALHKKRENDRNAQRNIREKARIYLESLKKRIKDLESGDEHEELRRRLAEAEKQVQSLTELLIQNGINPEQALSSASEKQDLLLTQGYSNETILERVDMDRPTVGFQGQQYSAVSQPMYPTIPANLHQPIVQPHPNGLGSIQYMGSPQHLETHMGSPAIVESPLSIGPSHHTLSHSASPQLSSSPQFPVSHSIGHSHHTLSHSGSPQVASSPQFPTSHIPHSMGALQQLAQPQAQFNQSMLVGSMGHMGSMVRSHPMSHSLSMPHAQSMPLHQNAGFQNAFSSPCLSDNAHYSSPNTMMWDNGADVAYRHTMSGYPAGLEHMTMV